MEVDETIKQTAHELLEETRTTMEEVAAKMLFIKKEGRPKSELRELITQMSLRFITLRQVNRSILMEEDRIKAETEAAKGPVDTTTLQLHNLMYEKNYYLKAITACKDFRSKYPDIELVPEEQFFSSAPQDIKGKVLANDGAHDLMLKRLNFELFQRKELCKLHEKLEQHKASLLDTISNRKKFLSSLPSHLKSLKKASLPVQQQLGNFHTKKLKQHHAAELLPPALYIVYSQLLAQKEAFGEKIEMEILGSIKDAQTFALQKVNKEKGLSNPDNNRLEDDAPDEEEDGQRRRKRPKKNLVKDSIEQSGVFQLHPLKIILHIYDDEDSGAKPSRLITLKFEYLVKLNAVCVGIEDTEEGPDTDILCNLFPDDTGLELPHQMAKLYSGDSLAFSERKNSRPYKWAQHLAGIDFLPEVPPILSNGETLNAENSKVTDISSGLALYRHENRVQTILQRIRSRKKAQMGLVEQLDSLMKLKWPLLTYENVLWASHTPLCTLQNWSPAGLVPDSSSLSAVMVGQASNNLDVDLDRRSVTSWDVENAREDGELPTALPVPPLPIDSSVTLSNEPDHSRSMALISKNVTPSKMVKSRSFSKYEDDLDFLLDSESEVEEQACVDELNESVTCIVGRPWEDCAAREFDFVLGRTCENDHIDHIGKLNAKVKISIEYPLRPPIFSLSTDSGHSKWYNVLRAMEAEVNLHILKVLPLDYENNMLAHQVRCLAMLFDFNFEGDEQRKSTSIIDVGLCKPVSGTILARSVRGRDHRKMISWNSVGCIPDYPS